MANGTVKISYSSFRSFLRSNGCERQFDAAFWKQCGHNHLDASLWDMLGADEGFFGYVFKWSETEEGYQFWKEVDSRWWYFVNG